MAFDCSLLPRHTQNVTLITAPCHDLKGTGRYFATMVTAPRRPCLSVVQEGGRVLWTPMGQCLHDHLEKMCAKHPTALDRVAIMPDHLHLCFRVTVPLKESILRVLATLRRFSTLDGCALSGESTLWEPHYHLFNAFTYESYHQCLAYTAANPERWWLTRHAPAVFRPHQVAHPSLPAEFPWQAVGHMSLLDAPLLYPIVIHRADTSEIVAKKTAIACDIARAGGVIIGGFISPREKNLLKTLYAAVPTLKLIHLSPHTLKDYKPPAHALEAFKYGRRLLLTSEPDTPADHPCTRAVCLRHNALAEYLAQKTLLT